MAVVPFWCYTVVVVVVGDSTSPLAILTMSKETLGFHNFCAWFSSFWNGMESSPKNIFPLQLFIAVSASQKNTLL